MSLDPDKRRERFWKRAAVLLALALGSCALDVDDEANALDLDPDDVGVLGIALSAASLLSANGTYGSMICQRVSTPAWSNVMEAAQARA